MTDELNTNAGAGPVEQGVRPGSEAPTLVERLRTRNGRADGFGLGLVCDEAADEIERLREALTEIAEGAESWTAIGLARIAAETLGPNAGINGHCPTRNFE